MPISDPIADMLTRIRNAAQTRQNSVSMPASRTKAAIAKILKESGFIRDFNLVKGTGPQGTIKIDLHYREDGKHAITGLKRVSKPGLRVYVGKDKIPRHYRGLATSIISTSQGIVTDREAKAKGLGGELLCYIW